MDNFKLHPASAADLGSSSPTHVGGLRPDSSSNKKKGSSMKAGSSKAQTVNSDPVPPHKTGNKNENDIRPVEWQTYYEEADSK